MLKQVLFILSLISSLSIKAQQVEKIAAFLDCSWYCDNDYIQTEIPFVNFIREPKEAQVHILVTNNSTGSGGQSYTFKFMGQQEFTHLFDTLSVSLTPDATEDEKRIAHVKTLKRGLFNFVKHCSQSENIDIVYTAKQNEVSQQEDSWKYWIFRSTINGRFSGEEGYKSKNYNIRFSANKKT